MSGRVLVFPVRAPVIAASDSMLKRGVYLAPFLSADGHEVLVAIDARGREAACVELRSGLNEANTTAALEQLLDIADAPAVGQLFGGPPSIERADRGVYWARPLEAGKTVAYAVDSHGNSVGRLAVRRGLSGDRLTAMLWQLLDSLDPATAVESGARAHLYLCSESSGSSPPR
jgi:hypothetical protein